MDSASKRPWYRLHWLTWVIAVTVLAVFVSRQLEKELVLGIGNLGMYSQRSSVGWPFQHAEVVDSGAMTMTGPGPIVPRTASTTYEWFVWPLVANCSFSFLFVASTTLVCECWLRRERRLQINLRQSLVALAILGVLLTLSRPWTVGYRDLDRENFEMEWSLIGIADLTTPLRWPLLIALGCTIYSLAWLVCFVIFCGWSLLRRNHM